MRISLNWLREYINLDGISNEEILHKLTLSGLEVEGCEDKSKLYDGIVVGYVKERIKHPNADKLSLTVITDGTDDYKVVCGAPNCEANKKVIFAKVGAFVPAFGETLKKAKIRGEESFGMLCSERELNLSESHDGIKILDENAPLGMPIADYFGLNDVEIEIGITPNRPDALSHFGVARDLAALFGRKISMPKVEIKQNNEDISNYASVEVQNYTDCPRYVAKVVKNVTVKESPDWLKSRLIAVGLRPINNLVDITNFILFEMGQPLHAFDLDKLAGKKIIVKNVAKGTEFTTLDSKKRVLPENALMICDEEKAVAVAGVMGGENSEITETTKNVLIEAAYFNPVSVRKTAKSLQISSDSSYRFERGCDPNIQIYAAERAAQLIAELGEGEIVGGIIDVYPTKIEKLTVSLRYARITKILGFEIASEKVAQILDGLGFDILSKTEADITVTVPTFRPDVEREIDLIEEVARIYGYDNIPTISKISIPLSSTLDETSYLDNVRNILTGMGFYEILTNSLLKDEISAIAGVPVKVLNPISADLSSLRTSLVQGALITVSNNLKVGEKNLRLFEVGHVFQSINDKYETFEDFTEKENLILVLTGKEIESKWYSNDGGYDFFHIKGYLNSFLNKILLDYLPEYSYNSSLNNIYENGFDILIKGKVVGTGGIVTKQLMNKFDISQKVFVAELNVFALKSLKVKNKKFKELQKYPKVYRDFAFVLDKHVTYAEVENVIKKNSSRLLKFVEPFDIFENKEFGDNKKSVAFRLEYYDENSTLKEEVIDKEFTKAINAVKNELKATLRGEI